MSRSIKLDARAFKLSSLFLAASFGLLAQSAVAEDKTTFWVDHDVLRWSSNSDKPKAGSTENKSGFVTTPNDVTIGIFWSDYGIYVTPGNNGGMIQGSYYVRPEWEIGLNLALNNYKVKDELTSGDKVKTDATTFGIFTTYYYTINTVSSFETNLTVNRVQNKTVRTPDAAPSTTSIDNQSTDTTVLLQYVYQVSPHFNVVPGLSYTVSSGKDDVSDSDIDRSGLSVNIAHFRYIF